MTKTDFTPKHGILASLFVIFLLYCLFQARFLIIGPQLWITTPKDGQTLSDPIILASGDTKNIAWISLNGRQIFTDEAGHWSEKLILSEGLSIMTVRVKDRFGREREEQVRVILE